MRPTKNLLDAAVKAIHATRNARPFIARALGINISATDMWVHVPLQYVFEVSALLKVPVELLRPDFFINDPLRRESVKAMVNRYSPAYRPIKIGPFPRLSTKARRKFKPAPLQYRNPDQQRPHE